MPEPRHLDTLCEQLLQELTKAAPSSSPRFLATEDGSYVVGSHIGGRRTRNEDRALIAKIDSASGASYCLALVCDGVGSSKRGDEAAAVACAAVVSYVSSNASRPFESLLASAVRAADDAVRARLSGAGQTTLCALLAGSHGDFCIANVGDSRGYSWEPDGDLIQITDDDTLQNEMRRLKMGPNSFVNDRRLEGSLSQALGETNRQSSDLDVHIYPKNKVPPGGVILASDGVWVNGEPAFHKICQNCSNPTDLVRRALASAYWMGGADNASCIAIRDPQCIPDVGPTAGHGNRITMWLPEQRVVLWGAEERQEPSSPPRLKTAKKSTRSRSKKNAPSPAQLEFSGKISSEGSGKKEKLENIIVEPDKD